jgi:hypothetical protein
MSSRAWSAWRCARRWPPSRPSLRQAQPPRPSSVTIRHHLRCSTGLSAAQRPGRAEHPSAVRPQYVLRSVRPRPGFRRADARVTAATFAYLQGDAGRVTVAQDEPRIVKNSRRCEMGILRTFREEKGHLTRYQMVIAELTSAQMHSQATVAGGTSR